jgi:hypothetical protein
LLRARRERQQQGNEMLHRGDQGLGG